jgi:HlyD family secretion protein
MHSPSETSPAQIRQTKQQFVTPEDYLSYELGKAVRELPPLYTRLLAGSLSLLVFGAIAWAYFSQVDEVAVATGEFIPSEQVRPVRALEGGVIVAIHVQEGETVQAGDILIEQDATLNQSEVDRLSQAIQLIQQDIARLEAELSGNSATGAAPLQDQLLEARLQEFRDRQAVALSEVNRLDSAVGEAQTRLTQLQGNLESAQLTLENAQRREESLRGLIDGAVPRFEYLSAVDQLTAAQDQVNSLQREIEIQQQTIRQAQESYQGARQNAERLASERASEVLTQVNQRREELSNLEGQLAQAQIRSDSDVIRAPISGRVYNLEATLGERTVEPGEDLLSILPDGQDLLLEVKVLNRDIGFIREGMRAKIKIATFPFQEFGTLEGTVEQISPNAVVDQQLGPVFMTQIRLQRTSVSVRGQEEQLVPGMVATAEIVTRQKSVLTFLLEPVTRRFGDAFSVR